MRRFSFNEIKAITKNFKWLLGKGRYGSVFKGIIDKDDGGAYRDVAVRLLDSSDGNGAAAVHRWEDLKLLLRCRHPNLVLLIGYCNDSGKLLLVYEYLQRGALSRYLDLHMSNSGGRPAPDCNLSWVQRLKICVGAARALDYLHSSAGAAVVHGYVKSSSILLDENFRAKMSDYGISPLVSVSVSELIDTQQRGYIDPYNNLTGRLTRKSDVYSFGVVLLEVLCGTLVVNILDQLKEEERWSLAEWIQRCLNDRKVYHIIDSRLRGEILPSCLTEFAAIAVCCLQDRPSIRPVMAEVVRRLELSLALQEERYSPDIADQEIAYSSSVKGKNKTDVADEYFAKQKIEAISAVTRGRKKQGQIQLRRFSFAEIKRATRNFNKALVLGQGGFGIVYNGLLDDGSTKVAIKCLNSKSSVQEATEFRQEIELLSEFRHSHLVSLIGFYNKDPLIIVYEYMPRGSLDKHLELGTPLSWVQRLKICIGAALGLHYLHHGRTIQDKLVIHRDIKSSNILLDDKWKAKISGFDISKIIPGSQSDTHVNTRVMGTMGYIDPDYLMTGRLTTKSDVYSFGVVLLEMLCGRKAVELSMKLEQRSLAEWVQHGLNEGKLQQIIDQRLDGQILPSSLATFVRLANQCLHETPSERPTMDEIVVRLKYLLVMSEEPGSSVIIEEIATTPWATDKQEIADSSLVEESMDGEQVYNEDIKNASTEQEVATVSNFNVDIYGISELVDAGRRKPRIRPARKTALRQFLFGIGNAVSGWKKYRKTNSLKIDTGSHSSELIRATFKQKTPKSEASSDKSTPHEVERSFRYDDYMVEEDIPEHPEVQKNWEYFPFPNDEVEQDALTHADFVQKAEVFNRRKDFLHLIMFYPMKPEAEIDFISLVDKTSSVGNYVRTLQTFEHSGDINSVKHHWLADVAPLFDDIQKHLSVAAFDLVAYLPEDMVPNRIGPPDSGEKSVNSLTVETKSELMPPSTSNEIEEARLIPEVALFLDLPAIHAEAVDSAICRASECIKEMTFGNIGISGPLAKDVADALKNLPEIRSMFGVVLCISVSQYQSISEIRSKIEEQIDPWKKRNQGTDEPIIQRYNCLLFLDCTDDAIDLQDFKFHCSNTFRFLQIVLTTGTTKAYCIMNVDLEIRTGDHHLPWNLFCKNFGHKLMAELSSDLQNMAARLVKECHGHLLAIILIARALKGVVDVDVWNFAMHDLISSQQQSSSSQVEGISEVMVGALRFIWPRKRIASKRCIEYCASQFKGTEFQKSSLISSWIKDGKVESQREGEDTFEDLISSFFLEEVGKNSVRMRDETRVVLLTTFVHRAHSLYLKQDGLGLTETPKVEEWDAREIHLSNNELSELPENPNCPILVKLFLQLNRELVEIPLTFFDHMPGLQVLDLSATCIKSLPPSLSKLVALREFLMKDCELLMELPPEIGAIKNLKSANFEGTELTHLPEGMEKLSNLEFLKVSLYRCADHFKESKKIIPQVVLSRLSRLKELSIYVDLDVEWWDVVVQCIIDKLPNLRNLETLKLYLPTVELLQNFLETRYQDGSQLYRCLSHFRLIVGRHQQRIISCLPLGLEEMFLQLEKCLKYTNGEGNMAVFAEALKHASAFYLDRHWTIHSLSILKIDEMDKLKFCLLAECNKMEMIVNGSVYDDEDEGDLKKPVLGSLQYLSIHYLKNLRCIWKGPIHNGCLSNLKILALHVCPKLTTIFTIGLLGRLTNLKCLLVEACPKASSLVTLGSSFTASIDFLPNLKNVSLLDLPELFSISNDLRIAPKLERMVIYNCPKLESLSATVVSNTGMKEIKGESEWWDALKWHEPDWTNGPPDYLTRVFVPFGRDGDLMDELAEEANSLQQLTQD